MSSLINRLAKENGGNRDWATKKEKILANCLHHLMEPQTGICVTLENETVVICKMVDERKNTKISVYAAEDIDNMTFKQTFEHGDVLYFCDEDKKPTMN